MVVGAPMPRGNSSGLQLLQRHYVQSKSGRINFPLATRPGDDLGDMVRIEVVKTMMEGNHDQLSVMIDQYLLLTHHYLPLIYHYEPVMNQ